MVPNGWERKSIKELCESIIDCVNKTAKHVDYTTPYKMIRTTNVRHGKVDTENVRYVDEDVYKQWIRRGAPQDGDIIFTREAPVGEAGILENSEGIFLGQRTMMYRVNPEVANNRFVFYSLMSGYCQKQIEDLSNGGTVAHMRVPDCGEIIINSPPLLEQQKIAKILSTWDKAISTTERLIDNSTQQKKALMQQLLTGKKRLLDESGKRFEGEWEEYKLGEITDFIRDGTHGTHKRYESGVLMLSAKNITKQNTVDFDDAPYISEEDYNKIHARYTIKSGDILLTVVGTLGRVALVPEELAEKFTLQRSVAIIRVAKGVCNQFLMQLFSSSDFTHLLHRKSNSTAQAGVYLGELGKLKILLPSLKEQQKIATVLTNADKEIELLEQQLADLQQEKKALMQVLLTGKKRVKLND